MAPHSTGLWLCSVKTLLRWLRMLKLCTISHMLIVKKAIVMPSSLTPCGISK